MQLKVGVWALGRVRCRARRADAGERLRDANAIGIAGGQRISQGKHPGVDAGAHHVGLEPGAFLIGEGGDRDRAARHMTGFPQCGYDLEAGQHAQRAVIPAAGCDRVDVRAQHDGRDRVATGEGAEHVADRVRPHGQAKLSHRVGEPGPSAGIRLRQGQPADAAVAGVADAPQSGEACQKPVTVEPQIVGHVLGLRASTGAWLAPHAKASC